MKALIDGDILVYSCGFASDANAKEQGIEHEPVEFCLNGVKETIRSLCETTEATDYQIFLTGRTNFRFEVDPEYKANRKDAPKPYHYQAIREYMQKYHPCSVSEGEEADDELGRAQATSPPASTVIISKDKDLNMIAGWHYNWSPKNRENGLYYIKPIDGLRFFYQQLITGDATDNISGSFRLFGKKATKALLAPLEALADERDMFSYVLSNVYEDDAVLMNRQAKLLWIRTNESWEEHCATI